MSGEIDMELDGTSVNLKTGDVFVQRGTNWINRGTAPRIIATVLIAAKSVEVGGKSLEARGKKVMTFTVRALPPGQGTHLGKGIDDEGTATTKDGNGSAQISRSFAVSILPRRPFFGSILPNYWKKGLTVVIGLAPQVGGCGRFWCVSEVEQPQCIDPKKSQRRSARA